jgi:hypothetical protein
MERIATQLDHLDCMLHEVTQFIDANKPLLDRARKLTDNPVTSYLNSRHRPKAKEPAR